MDESITPSISSSTADDRKPHSISSIGIFSKEYYSSPRNGNNAYILSLDTASILWLSSGSVKGALVSNTGFHDPLTSIHNTWTGILFTSICNTCLGITSMCLSAWGCYFFHCLSLIVECPQAITNNKIYPNGKCKSIINHTSFSNDDTDDTVTVPLQHDTDYNTCQSSCAFFLMSW